MFVLQTLVAVAGHTIGWSRGAAEGAWGSTASRTSSRLRDLDGNDRTPGEPVPLSISRIQSAILEVRGQRVILDRDLAEL